MEAVKKYGSQSKPMASHYSFSLDFFLSLLYFAPRVSLIDEIPLVTVPHPTHGSTQERLQPPFFQFLFLKGKAHHGIYAVQ